MEFEFHDGHDKRTDRMKKDKIAELSIAREIFFDAFSSAFRVRRRDEALWHSRCFASQSGALVFRAVSSTHTHRHGGRTPPS